MTPSGELARAPQSEPFAARLQARVAALVARPLFWIALVGLVFSYPIVRAARLDIPAPPAISIPLPVFHLVDQWGRPFSNDDLRGKVWVADFIFTSCPTVCPRLTQRMVEVQKRALNLGDSFHLVSFTVDPENDTPERLQAFSHGYKVNPRRWTFATGSVEDIEKTVVEGFKMAMAKQEDSPGVFTVLHSERLVLVDQEGRIRGFFEATDEGVEELVQTVNVLVNVPR